MFDIYNKNNTASTAAKISTAEFSCNECAFGTSLPLLQRNVRRRYRKLYPSSAIQEPCCAANELISAVGTTSKSAMVDAAPLMKTPFLKRNLCIQQVATKGTSSLRKAVVGTKKATVDSMNSRRQYRIHCIKYERNEKVKNNTILASFLCTAYQCPFCVSFKGVREKLQML